jgi:aldehyde dehydrogenase (NAD+)
MSDARTLPPQLPLLKLRIEGPHVDPIESGTHPVMTSREASRGGDLSHHILEEGSLQVKAVWMKLPSKV